MRPSWSTITTLRGACTSQCSTLASPLVGATAMLALHYSTSSSLSRPHRREPASTQSHLCRSNALHALLASDATRQTGPTTTVVLGAGMSGLIAAKVLAKYFDNVIMIDKDSFDCCNGQNPAEAVKRKGLRRGVTQYHHVHVLAARGVSALDDLFDSQFVPALQQAGCVLNDVVTGFTSYHPAGGQWAAPTTAAQGPVLMGQATRHLVENVTRRLLQDTPGVTVLPGSTVTGLVLQRQEGQPSAQQQQTEEQAAGSLADGQSRVVGVVLSDGREVRADLVVDCSGRQSKMSQWLAASGLPTPRVERVDANLSYVSWLVKLDPEVAAHTLRGKKGVYAIAAYPQTVGSMLVEVEGGLHIAGLGIYSGQKPPFKDEQLAGFMQQYAWHPVVSEALVGAVPVAPASRFSRVNSTWRHFEEVVLPEGLLLTADAVCSFNPIYGHGMTVAALEATKLDELLAARQAAAAAAGGTRDLLVGLPAQYQQAITPIIQTVWDLSVGGDLRYSSTTTTEQRNTLTEVKNAYFDVLMVLAADDVEVTERVLRVMHLVDPLSALMAPRLLGKVLLHQLKAPFLRAVQAVLPASTATSSSSTNSNSAAGGVKA